MESIVSFLSSIPGASRRIVQKTQEDLYIASSELAEGLSTHSAQARALAGSADTSKLHSYPNNPDGHIHAHAHHARISPSTVCLGIENKKRIIH